MSSPVPRSERVRRGETTSVASLPDRVQAVLIDLAAELDDLVLCGSYWRGNWADDSDIDVHTSTRWVWARSIADRIGRKHDIRIDVGVYSPGGSRGLVIQ